MMLLVQLLCFFVLVVAAWGAGSIGAPQLECENRAALAAVRVASGLAIIGLVLLALGLAGALDRTMSFSVMLFAVAVGIWKGRDLAATSRKGTRIAAVLVAVIAAPVFLTCLYPPHAFDETLYHLPVIEQFAESGGLPYLAALRLPVFPHLDEVLRVPLFQLGGDVATHLLSLLAMLATVALVFAWFAERGEDAIGWVAVALFVSAPLVVYLAATGYVEALLTMFVAAAFYAFDRWWRTDATAWLVASGCFAGSAAGVKYLGLFWVAALFAAVILRRQPPRARIRSAALFALACGIALAPWYGRIVYFTGNPLFPYSPSFFWSSESHGLPLPVTSLSEKVISFVRVPWDTYFARERLTFLPPLSAALFIVAPLVVYGAIRNALIRTLALLVFAWTVVWLWLPHDPRYLVPALPLAAVAGAISLKPLLERVVGNRMRAIGLIAVVVALPGPLYALYTLQRNGAIPLDPPAREAWLAKKVPEYAAIAFLNARSKRTDVTWLCGSEQVRYYLRGKTIGDQDGDARFELLTSARDAIELDRRAGIRDARYLLVVKRICSMPSLESREASRHFTMLYDDATTRLYERVAR